MFFWDGNHVSEADLDLGIAPNRSTRLDGVPQFALVEQIRLLVEVSYESANHFCFVKSFFSSPKM